MRVRMQPPNGRTCALERAIVQQCLEAVPLHALHVHAACRVVNHEQHCRDMGSRTLCCRHQASAVDKLLHSAGAPGVCTPSFRALAMLRTSCKVQLGGLNS